MEKISKAFMGYNILQLPVDRGLIKRGFFATFDGKNRIPERRQFQAPPKSTPQETHKDNVVVLSALQRLLRDSKTKTLDKEFNVGTHMR